MPGPKKDLSKDLEPDDVAKAEPSELSEGDKEYVEEGAGDDDTNLAPAAVAEEEEEGESGLDAQVEEKEEDEELVGENEESQVPTQAPIVDEKDNLEPQEAEKEAQPTMTTNTTAAEDEEYKAESAAPQEEDGEEEEEEESGKRGDKRPEEQRKELRPGKKRVLPAVSQAGASKKQKQEREDEE
ncbi:hypothetical protein F4775DRAFT_95438 [Biscogniauxia sp. FL1348]|nr:hypothetical protein F4775DRAFT_95438 [Biscogniauxia sp. FL1348]